MVEFSRRTRWELAETEWAKLVAQKRASGERVFDLTASNPTRCGLPYDPAATLLPLTARQSLDYDPDPRGNLAAREAVCGYYREHQVALDPGQIILTTSTSEAYSFLFRLLCDPGDEVLIARPSYPLFDFLAALDDVRLSPYDLFYDHGWQIDLEGLRSRLHADSSSRMRAIIVVHPNNPTGHFTSQREREVLEEICREHNLALIVDEVFLDYRFSGYGFSDSEMSFAAGEHRGLTFVLSGLSKVAALPQMKAGWIVCRGEEQQRSAALGRLEVIADTFLSVNTPVQCALPEWLSRREGLQGQIRSRTRSNLSRLDDALRLQTMVTRLDVQGGWYAVLRVPGWEGDEETALELLRLQGVAMHAGSFFGFPGRGWLVISLLAEEAEFSEGITRLVTHFQAKQGESSQSITLLRHSSFILRH